MLVGTMLSQSKRLVFLYEKKQNLNCIHLCLICQHARGREVGKVTRTTKKEETVISCILLGRYDNRFYYPTDYIKSYTIVLIIIQSAICRVST